MPPGPSRPRKRARSPVRATPEPQTRRLVPLGDAPRPRAAPAQRYYGIPLLCPVIGLPDGTLLVEANTHATPEVDLIATPALSDGVDNNAEVNDVTPSGDYDDFAGANVVQISRADISPATRRKQERQMDRWWSLLPALLQPYLRYLQRVHSQGEDTVEDCLSCTCLRAPRVITVACLRFDGTHLLFPHDCTLSL